MQKHTKYELFHAYMKCKTTIIYEFKLNCQG